MFEGDQQEDQQAEGELKDERREPETDEERPADLEPKEDDDVKGGRFHGSDVRLKRRVRAL